MHYRKLWSDDIEQRVRREAVSLDRQERAAGPVQMCTRCVVTNQRPRIVFDADGVCSACRYAERKRSGIDWAERRRQLDELLGAAGRGSARRGAARQGKAGHGTAWHGRDFYNAIVPASGGKDSSFVAWTLRDLGMTSLLARWQPHIITPIGERNWQALIHSGFDAVTAQPNGLLHRKLSRLALEYYGDPFLPFIYGQLCWPMHVAQQTGVKLVFYGENGEAEYGGDPGANDKPCWDDEHWERVYMKGAGIDKLLQIGRTLGAISEDEARRASPFYRLPVYSYRKDMPQFHWLGYYLPWHPQGNYYHAVEHTGFEVDEQRSEGTYSRYASIDDKLDGLHYWFGYLKFGIGRCTSDAAHEVRDDDLTRDEALALVAQYDHERPTRHLNECLAYLGMDADQLARVEERFRRTPCAP